MPSSLDEIAQGFAIGIKLVDGTRPIAVNQRSGVPYQAGIGPHTETQTTNLVVGALAARTPDWGEHQLGVPYGDGTRQACDLCLGSAAAWSWAIEIKMLRLMGDNGKANDNILMHILSPYPAHRSALTDCEKLVDADIGQRKAILIYGYDYPGWPMDPVIEAFETLAACRVRLGPRSVSGFDHLVHPVHQEGRVFGWELLGRL